ncbi:hypothetical protein QYF36_017772 [Acer negundo]|nr:hypothetical protein QYF36_017772 [Acer negundo]
MMRALELGDKITADKIELLIRNFDQSSIVPISFYIPTAHETSAPNFSSASSFDSNSSEMTKSSKAGGSKRRAPKIPKASLVSAQTIVDSDVEDHHGNRLHFSFDRSSTFDSEMFSCGVTLPLQPFIARFLADAELAPAQLAPNSYRKEFQNSKLGS